MLACDAVIPKRGLVSPTGKPIPLAGVRPNAGLAAMYQRRLDDMIGLMHRDITRRVLKLYRDKPPELAQDAPDGGGSGTSPAMALRREMDSLGSKWTRRFDQAAKEMGDWFATKAADRSDSAMKDILRKAGFTVKFTMSAAANDALQATIGEQIGLIKSIPEKHLLQVQGLVMRGVQTGRDLHVIAKGLEDSLGVTKHRAAFIARDQTNKANATITRVRQLELGITQAKWRHSKAGNHPRPSHVKADGEVYDVAQGMEIDGEMIWPGQLPNCGCTSSPIIPGFKK